MTDQIKEKAPQILAAIQKSSNILLHAHPSPDPDSVGGILAMKFALEQMGKKATLILGDSEAPNSMKDLPGFEQIIPKNYFQIDPNQFDLFLIQDSASLNQISKLGEVKFPDSMTTVVIDHHISNSGFGTINLVEPNYSSTCQIVYELLTLWEIQLSPEMAANLMLGLYYDTGGFKYPSATPQTLEAAAHLAQIAPDYHKYIFNFENSNEKESILFEGLALNSIETFFNGRVAVSAVSYKLLQENGIKKCHTQGKEIPNILKSVIGWDIGISLVEVEPNLISLSFRTRDAEKFNVSKVAVELGGGGHKAASGGRIEASFDEAKKILLNALAKTYSELDNP